MPLNRPTQFELLDAVEAYLRDPAQDPKADTFFRRVASNVLAIVVRELQLADEFERAEQQLLEQLLRQSGENETLNQMLNDKILQQDIEFNSALTSALLNIAERKLEIDNPGYRDPS